MAYEQRDELRRKIRERAQAKREQLLPPEPPPRYDEIFLAGTEWLDRIARGDEEEDLPPRDHRLQALMGIEGPVAKEEEETT